MSKTWVVEELHPISAVFTMNASLHFVWLIKVTYSVVLDHLATLANFSIAECVNTGIHPSIAFTIVVVVLGGLYTSTL